LIKKNCFFKESEPDGVAGVSIILPSISEAGEESAASSTCAGTTRGEEPIELSAEQQKLAKELTSLSGEVITST
jgi:hypothetical protein